MSLVSVPSGSRSYPIYIGFDLFDKSLLRQHIPGDTVLIVTNETIGPLYLEKWVHGILGSLAQ